MAAKWREKYRFGADRRQDAALPVDSLPLLRQGKPGKRRSPTFAPSKPTVRDLTRLGAGHNMPRAQSRQRVEA